MAKPLKFKTQNHYRRHRRSQLWARALGVLQFMCGVAFALFAALAVGGGVLWLVKGDLP